MQGIETIAYKETLIEFDLKNENVMVNATEMAKLFGRKVEAFVRNETTQAFINSALKSENSRFLGIENESDLIISRQRSGTWMHRVLALKFAAWLDADFEVWVYYTIEQLMFGTLRHDLIEKAEAQRKRDVLHKKLLAENADYAEMLGYHGKASKIGKIINTYSRSQLTIFVDENNN